MAHAKDGCYLEKVDKDGELRGHAVKICQSATWPNGPFSWWPAGGIKNNCNSCKQVWDASLNGGKGWATIQVPLNLIHNGCMDIGSAEKRQCRSSPHSAGYDYVWTKDSSYQCMFNTLGATTTDAGGCVNCLGKVANQSFLASLLALLLVS